MPFLGQQPVEGYKTTAKQTITGDGSTSYTLDNAVTSGTDLEVFVNNVRQEPGTDYSASGNTITFTTAVESSDSCWLVYQGRASTTTSIESDNLADGSVTATKLDTTYAPAASPSFTGNVGIGTTTPARQFTLYEATTPRFAIQNSTTGQGNGDGFQVNLSGSDVYVYNQENGIISFGTNDTERMRILSSGGLTFNGDTAAANALDDYEEGTHTVTVSTGGGSITLSSTRNKFTYTKVGNMVTVRGRLDVSSVSSPSGELYLSLPFGASTGNTEYDSPITLFVWSATAAQSGLWIGWIPTGGNVMYLRYGDSLTPSSSGASYIDSNTEFRVCATYAVG